MAVRRLASFLAGNPFKPVLNNTVNIEMHVEPTYIFRNGKTYATVEGQVVASIDGEDVEALEAQLESEGVAADTRHTHILTPNGVRGQILGRVKGLWGDEVTVRLENGRIVKLPVNGDLRFASETKEASDDLIDTLRRTLEASYGSTRVELAQRSETLTRLKTAASAEVGTGVARDQELHSIIVQADYEMTELADAMRHLDDQEAEAYRPPAPYRMEVTPQGGPNLKSDTFLDGPLAEMSAEAEGTNYNKLMDEGPEEFVADISDGALADAGTVRSMAASFIRTKTAMAEPELRDRYEKVWLERIESLRRAEVVARKESVRKEAAAEDIDISDAPDSALFG